LCRAEGALINYNIVRIALANHPFRVYKAVHVNRDPAVIHEHEVRAADQPEMARPKSLDEELFRLAALKTIAGFLNANGGRLIVGVRDDGTPLGIEADQFPSEDKLGLHLVNLINGKMGPQTMTLIHLRFDEYEDRRVLVVECRKSAKPVFVKDGDAEYFYIRTGPSTTQLTPSQTQDYIQQHWK
jgi:predicted HTH transcriptional regulator